MPAPRLQSDWRALAAARAVCSYIALSLAAHQAGAATAAYGAGLMRSVLLTYDPPGLAAGATCLAAAVAALSIRRLVPGHPAVPT